MSATAIVASPGVCWTDPEAGLPVFRVFPSSDFSAVGDINCVARDYRGRLIVGDAKINIFDGRTWSAIELPRSAGIRRLDADKEGRVWVAAEGDFGYLEDDETGTLRFHSLTPENPEDGQASGWYAFRQDDATLFVVRDAIAVWRHGVLEWFPLPSTQRLFAFRFRGGVLIAQNDRASLWRNGRLEPFDFGGLTHVAWAVDCPDGSTLVRAKGGHFRLTKAGVEPIPKEQTRPVLDGAEIEVVRISNDLICVVTATRGLFILTNDGRVLRQIGRDEGLPSPVCVNAVLDPEDGLWVTTDRGVVRFDHHNLVTLYDARNGLGGGTVEVLTGNPSGMVAIDKEGARQLQIEPRQASGFVRLPHILPVWNHALTVDEHLLVGGLRTLVSYRNRQQEFDLGFPSDILFIASIPSDPGRALLSTENGIIELDLRSGPPPETRMLVNTGAFPNDLRFDGDGRLWVVHSRQGISWLRSDNGEPRIEPLSSADALPSMMKETRLFSLDGHVYAYDSKQIWHLPHGNDRSPELQLTGVGLSAAEEIAKTETWAVAGRGDERRLARLRTEAGGHLMLEIVACPELEAVGEVKTIARDLDGRAVWIGGYNGALRVSLQTPPKVESPPSAPCIVRVDRHVDEQPGTLLALAGNESMNHGASGVLTFELRDGDDILDAPTRLQARLLGRDSEWSPTGPTRSYTGLWEGDYELQVRAVDMLGRSSPTTSYTFTVRPPWFRSAWAYAGYGLLLIAAMVGSAKAWSLRIKRRNLELERIVKQRTEALQRAMAARTAFLANMGHEIRNPLNGVVGLIDMLRHDGKDPEQRHLAIERLGTCADQLVAVVEDVLEFSRVDAGQISIRPQPFFVRQPIAATLDIFHAAEPDRTLTLEAAAPDLEERVVGDPVRIRQVLVNYVANALKFAPTGPVTVGVEKRGDGFVFSVADQGPGIPPDQQARLFMRFSRGTFAHREGIPGSGLGLAACRAYAEAMGGEVWVESEPGAGSTFYLRVPLRPAGPGETRSITIVPDIMAARHALVVDDHEFNRIVLTDLLGRMGAQPVAVPDIAAAQESFTAQVPDVVFVDFDLAGATGVDLARWIRTQARAGRDVPIVATSAFEVEEIRQRCADAGMDGFIAKPLTPHKIAETMTRIEALRTGGVELAAQVPLAPTTSRPGAGFLDLLSDGDPVRRKELEKSAWREVRAEASAALRHAHRGHLSDAGRHAHRLTSAAVMLGLAEIVTASRQMTAAARAGDAEGTTTTARALREALIAARRQLRGGG